MVETEDNDNALARVCACNASGQILMDRQGGIGVVNSRCVCLGGDFTISPYAKPLAFHRFVSKFSCLRGFFHARWGWTKSGARSVDMNPVILSSAMVFFFRHKPYAMSLGPSLVVSGW